MTHSLHIPDKFDPFKSVIQGGSIMTHLFHILDKFDPFSKIGLYIDGVSVKEVRKLKDFYSVTLWNCRTLFLKNQLIHQSLDTVTDLQIETVEGESVSIRITKEVSCTWKDWLDYFACSQEEPEEAPAKTPKETTPKADILVNAGALVMALSALRRSGKSEIADELEKTATIPESAS